MINDKIKRLEQLINENNIEDEESKIILYNYNMLFINNDFSSFDSDMKEEILEKWNTLLDNKIAYLESMQRVL